jgi:hypothetical protein
MVVAEYGWTNDFGRRRRCRPDADRQFTWQEYIGNSNPTNPLSFFHVQPWRASRRPFSTVHPMAGQPDGSFDSFRTNPAPFHAVCWRPICPHATAECLHHTARRPAPLGYIK